jgi:hypothetical protein
MNVWQIITGAVLADSSQDPVLVVEVRVELAAVRILLSAALAGY